MTDRTCIADGCSRPGTRRSMCTLHYQRWRRHGDVSVYRPDATRGCSVDGCASDHYGRGWCVTHWTRWKKTGDAMEMRPHFSPLAGKTRDANPAWVGDEAGYGAVHRRLSVMRGPARDHVCAHCGDAAAQWAYTHDDPDERVSKEGPFSVDPDCYIPLCISCHKRFDQAVRKDAAASLDQAT